MKLGVLPTTNLPIKSHETLKSPERSHLNIVKDIPKKENKKPVYKTFIEFCNRTQKLKLNDWTIDVTDTTVSFKWFTSPYTIPNIHVIVDNSLQFNCAIYGWIIPDDHELYKTHFRSLRNITISQLLNSILSYKLCDGINGIESTELICHSIACNMDLETITNPRNSNLHIAKQFKRSRDCIGLLRTDTSCENCKNFVERYNKNDAVIKKHLNMPAKPNAPLMHTHPNRVRLALQEERVKCNKLTKQVERIQEEIQSKGVELNKDLSSDINQIMIENSENITPFMKMFWEQQQKQFSKGSGARYHPMVIRFCLSLASKSASAYDELRSSNVLTLPSRRTLRDYRNAIRPSAGFNPQIVQELIKTSSKLTGFQRYIVLSFDEIKVQENLVFDKHSGELVGFVDLGEVERNYSSFKNVDDLASHVLVYYICGIASDLKYSFAYLATKGITAHQIMPTFWEAVGILEFTCKLPVIACVSDGASPNRKFYRMHHMMDDQLEVDVVYRTINLFAPERFIWFFADGPHLMKTSRNCAYHSGMSP